LGFIVGALAMLALVLMETRPTETVQTVQARSSPPPPENDNGNVFPTDAFPRRIVVPVDGVKAKDIRDTFDETRGQERKHEATDILAPKGTPVIAVDDGMIQKLFLSKPGGVTLYQFDPGEQFCYYYAHLDRYVDGISEGMWVRQGQVIGYVGTTGNAPPNTPHLHFGIFKLGPERRWWEGTPINPYPILIREAQK
jgi:murein DD-endopeptidase MepM/ murein hydrolase activator NlpD